MDDFTTNILNESKNEWSILMINAITPHVIDGFKSIFNESLQLCQNNEEPDKYLMTYQNLLSRIPSWNQTIIETEKNRILAKSKCSYLEDLVTCVHIIQLKLLSCVRVGIENKKINIDIPDLSIFLHKIYISVARKLYSNIYLFELDIAPLEQQRRNREFEVMVQTCIMNTIRDQLPVEQLLRQYIDDTQEIDVIKVETKSEPVPVPVTKSEPPPPPVSVMPPPISLSREVELPKKISFNDTVDECVFEPFDLSEASSDDKLKLDIIDIDETPDLGIIDVDLNECVIDLDKEGIF